MFLFFFSFFSSLGLIRLYLWIILDPIIRGDVMLYTIYITHRNVFQLDRERLILREFSIHRYVDAFSDCHWEFSTISTVVKCNTQKTKITHRNAFQLDGEQFSLRMNFKQINFKMFANVAESFNVFKDR